MTLQARKSTEVREKVASLRSELDHWEAESEAGRPLEKHNTQIRAIVETLEPFVEALETQFGDDARTDEALLTRTGQLELRTLVLHRIWDYFRSKLALRYVDWFAAFLAAADDFAWSCYQPIDDRAPIDSPREPPLVFFNASWSPLTRPRGTVYVPDDMLDMALGPDEFRDALRRLPIHVIGIPWFQLAHLAGAPAIGHEVGHNVEAELGLLPALKDVLGGAVRGGKAAGEPREAWDSWIHEVFADVYGTLATGPAYVSMLADVLAGPTGTAADQAVSENGLSAYPPRGLRILVGVETLRHGDLGDEADRLLSEWMTATGDDGLCEHASDVRRMVDALVEQPYDELGDATLTDLLDFRTDRQALAVESAEQARTGYELLTEDIRCLIAAARLAFEADPVGYTEGRVPSALKQQITSARKAGTRARSDEEREAEDAARSLRNAERGQELLTYVDDLLPL